jgi:hypothetical protein
MTGVVEKGIPQGRKPELFGGGLIRNLGGWSAVLALGGGKKGRAIFDPALSVKPNL